MTKAEQARVVAWRLKILRYAHGEPRQVARTCRHFGISRTLFYRWKRRSGTRKRLYQFTAIDDCTRIRVLKVYDACNQRNAIQFLNDVRQRLPFRIQVLQTDYGAEFQSQFHWHAEGLDIKHVYIRPRTPRLNGKVERSHRIDDPEFYQLLDRDGISDDIHLFNEKLREWEDYYNYHRPHGRDRHRRLRRSRAPFTKPPASAFARRRSASKTSCRRCEVAAWCRMQEPSARGKRLFE